MKEIKLDPKKLLGFKIIANGESSATLHSPKIGGKSCTVTSDVSASGNATALRPKIGVKVP